jgi:hypothetical protein
VAVRRPEKETHPKLFYKGAHQATLDPIAARRPEGGIFMWSEQGEASSHRVTSGHPGPANNAAAAMLAYDVPHSMPWGLGVAAYVWTKAIAAGAFLVGAFTGVMMPWISAVFLAITFALLIGDLEHPKRFYLILTRPQWKSWLVRGGMILGAFAAVIGLHLIWTPPRWVTIAGAIVAAAAGTYTAWLFAQAKARDLWQSPLLAPQHFVATVLAGAAALVLATRNPLLVQVMMIATAIHLVLIAAEVLMPHPTAHARLAARELTRGRYAIEFTAAVLLQLIGVLGASFFGAEAAVLILAGLLIYEVAHVGAAQSVPLA